ncbi:MULTISPECIES: hypothetical protein [Kordiimonas]|uniref:hypothetical protein n=1 Tax=Kordiimonas TaxID=288021 RepID=UPI002580CD69|nr:hypothetical protein [Kordiimonas sp. UBA4487]
MKQLLALALALTFLSGPVLADTPNKPYEEMTIAELQAVDTKPLSRDEKKHLKSVLKAKKKAEKARLREEKKRAKAEAKRLKKARREASKQLSYIQAVYKKSGIFRDPGNSRLRIRGADASISSAEAILALSSNGGHVGYFIRTYYDPVSGTLSPQIYLTVKFSDTVDQDQLDARNATAEAYANRRGWWKNYRWATLGGAGRNLTLVDRYSNNAPYYPSFFEEYVIRLAFEDITAAVKAGSTLRVDVRSASRGAGAFTVAVPYDYLLGYLMRLSEADMRLAYLKDWAGPRVTALKATLDTNPPGR